MSSPAKRPAPAVYVLRVDGHLGQHWAPWFVNLTLVDEEDGTTTLTGSVSDQAELHGLLTKIRDLGITLLSLAVVEPPSPDEPVRPPAGPGPSEKADR